uniref:ISXO2-like transposase domain-containing protein n=1 Tax=Amphimedon queenslandica TaxID=400682 RepID=A0A1X7TV20_AMPQE
MSDCWKAYSKLEQLCYKHGMVNHSVEFVNSDTVEHTQMIESTGVQSRQVSQHTVLESTCMSPILQNASFV